MEKLPNGPEREHIGKDALLGFAWPTARHRTANELHPDIVLELSVHPSGVRSFTFRVNALLHPELTQVGCLQPDKGNSIFLFVAFRMPGITKDQTAAEFR